MGDCAPPWRASSHLCVSWYAEGFAGRSGPSAAPYAAGKSMAIAGIVCIGANVSGARLDHKTAGTMWHFAQNRVSLSLEGDFAHLGQDDASIILADTGKRYIIRRTNKLKAFHPPQPGTERPWSSKACLTNMPLTLDAKAWSAISAVPHFATM